MVDWDYDVAVIHFQAKKHIFESGGFAMKKLILSWLFFMLFGSLSAASIDPVGFIVIRMDYLTYQFKYLYYFTQPYDICLPDSNETARHDFYVRIIPAVDFGETTIRHRATGQKIYHATTVWAGSGEHLFPSSPLAVIPDTFVHSQPQPKFIDFEDYFFYNGDAIRADSAWRHAWEIAPLALFGEQDYEALIYLHYFSVGIGDPTTAEWVIIFSTIADEIPAGDWKNIGAALPSSFINDVHVNFAFPDTIYAATSSGAHKTEDGGKSWTKVEFTENKEVNVAVIESVPNPWVDCLCEVIFLGTEEYTLIPEERKGRVFRSMLDGSEWEDTFFPGEAVTAIGINPLNPITAYAASFNPFYGHWGLYKFEADTGWKKIMPQPFDSRLIRINCIAVSPSDSNLVLVATDQGLFLSRDNAANWEIPLAHFNISSVQFFYDKIFVTTNGNTRSDGIYVSEDRGLNWHVFSYSLFNKELAVGYRNEYLKPAYFFLADTFRTVSVTRETPYAWQSIGETLSVKQVTCLGFNQYNPEEIVVGTINGLFRYEETITKVPDMTIKRPQFPESENLLTCYPNPFNSNVKIKFDVNRAQVQVKLVIYNELGQQVNVILNEAKTAGEYTVVWNGKSESGLVVPSGIYFCRMETNFEKQNIIKLVYLK